MTGILFTATIPGHPATQGSKRHVGGGRLVEMDKKLPAWRQAITHHARRVAGPSWTPLDGPLAVELVVYLPRPKTSKFGDLPAGPPDLDKLQRAMGDALTIAGVIADDARITRWVDPRKRWGSEIFTGAIVTITRDHDEPQEEA